MKKNDLPEISILSNTFVSCDQYLTAELSLNGIVYSEKIVFLPNLSLWLEMFYHTFPTSRSQATVGQQERKLRCVN